MSIRSAIRERLVAPILEQLRMGLAPDALALAIVVGLCLAVIPVIGVTTILCVLAAPLLRLNQPVILAINFGSAPLQLLLLIPFFRLGERLFGVERQPLALATVVRFVSERPLVAIQTFWIVTLHGIVAWLLVSIPAGALSYFVIKSVLRTIARRVRPTPRAEVVDAS